MSGTYYLTTAISYVNAKPHIGHAYEFIASDAIVRYQKMLGKEVYFLSGVDEHSAKVEKTARAEGITPAEYCDRMAPIFKELHDLAGTGLDRFIRTSEPAHHETTKELLRRSYEKGDIYRDVYEGWYCVSCEAYYQNGDLLEGNLCPTHKIPCEWLKENNYFFRLSKYTEALKRHFAENPEFVYPETYKREMLSLLDQGLRDISVSRSTSKWGVPIPWDDSHIAYVWYDALSNYITGAGFLQDEALFSKFWPADAHVIGKDITRFHSLFWPAMLMSCDIPLPKQVLVHGFIYHRGEKMSKTIGNIVDPFSLIEEYGRDPLRYFLLREIAFGQDGNYSEEALINRYNADLANDIGNLFSRVLSMMKKYRDAVVPSPAGAEDALRETMARTIPAYRAQMDRHVPHQALATVWELISHANRYVDERAPWALAKDESKAEQLDRVMLNLAEALRVTAVLVYPFMPGTALEMLNRLGCPADGHPLLSQLDESCAVGGNTVQLGSPLFPRLDKQ